jgi:CheY-like chemotaxis protein
MPKYSGYELLQTFTALSQTQKIPVIIVSGEAGGQTKNIRSSSAQPIISRSRIDFAENSNVYQAKSRWARISDNKIGSIVIRSRLPLVRK